MKEQQMFAEPQHYWPAENKSGTELDRLRAGVAEAEAAAAKLTDWTERVRAEGHAKSLQRELQSAEFNAKQVQGGSSQQAQQRGEGQAGYIVSDDGGAYLFVSNMKKRRAPRTAVAGGTAQEYLEPTPPVSGRR